MNKYENELINIAIKLDALCEDGGEFSRFVESVIKEDNDKAALNILAKISDLIGSNNHTLQETKLASELKTRLIEFYGYKKITDICNGSSEMTDKRTLEELLAELNELTGLKNVKEKVNDLIAYQKVQKMRREKNLHTTKNTLHTPPKGSHRRFPVSVTATVFACPRAFVRVRTTRSRSA